MQVLSDEISLFKEIFTLVSYQQEGSYWDFKRQWYSDNSDMLHDIICMANNLDNRDAYIIIGIDEQHDYSVCGVNEDPNRKSTQNIVDFLKNKSFAGGIRPTVFVRTLLYQNKEVDVIVIMNSYNTPYYLTDRYSGVQPHHIYTRILDTNTPINRSADVDKTEMLWRKRFHLLDSPLERIKSLLVHPEDWKNSPATAKETMYYRYSPEFTIETESDVDRTGYEFYMLCQTDTQPRWFTIGLFYHQTQLDQFMGTGLDGARCFVVAPEKTGINYRSSPLSGWDITYSYFVENSLRYCLHEFYLAEHDCKESYQYALFIRYVLVFHTENERQTFEAYVAGNYKTYEGLSAKQELPIVHKINGYDMEYFRKMFIDAAVLQTMLSSFRQNQKESN